MIFSGVINNLPNPFYLMGENVRHSQRDCIEVVLFSSSYLKQISFSYSLSCTESSQIVISSFTVLSCLLLVLFRISRRNQNKACARALSPQFSILYHIFEVHCHHIESCTRIPTCSVIWFYLMVPVHLVFGFVSIQ